MKLAGDLACQNDSFAQTLTTRVVECRELEKGERDWAKNAALGTGRPAPEAWWVVQLDDTVLFPEGGGQPFDTGMIGDAFCGNVQRKGLAACHLVDRKLEVDSEVKVSVDWPRRLDHMQQHTGQHLLSATVEKLLGLDTMCWGLGLETSYIQLPVGSLKKESIQEVEDACNEKIRQATPVVMTQHTPASAACGDSTDAAPSAPAAAGGGKVRMIDVQGVENSPCCGTHVAHLGQLQSLKLLHTESKADTVRLFFVFGRRVQNLLGAAYDRERALMKLLGTHPGDFENAISRVQKSAATLKKTSQAALKELASFVGDSLAATAEPGKENQRIRYHRDDADMPFLQTVVEKVSAKDPSVLIVLTQGEKGKGGEGQMLIACGKEDRFKVAVAKAEEVLQAKGGANKGKWRGKVPNLKLLKDFDKLEL
ncbi:putative alanyl-tRNA editing protein alaX [Diplonema papillatum]|nr:putative alanyl-tRNA editing protein alaX [Diplonema papillatum]